MGILLFSYASQAAESVKKLNVDILKNKKLFLLDLDGTLYISENIIGKSLEFLDTVAQKGGKYMFLTNNSSKSVDTYIERLSRMGFKVSEDNFFTSAQATAYYIEKNYGKNTHTYVVGTKSFKDSLIKEGFDITDELDDDIKLLVVGYDTELTFKKLEEACILIHRGVDYIASNPDLACPSQYGFIPDCGAITACIECATGKKPHYAGKPDPTMVYMAIEKSGFSPEEACMIGDRLYTDIAIGNNAGITSVAVLTGETTREEIAASNGNLVPDVVCESIDDIYDAIR